MIHQYINNGYHIVLDVNSGSVHSVDALLYDAVEVLAKIVPDMEKPMPLTDDQKKAVREALVCKYSAEDIEDALSDIQELINAEELFAADIYKDYVIDFKKRQTVVKALCLHIAHDCNLACKYCFAEEGEYHGRRALMSFEVGKKALDFLIANSGNRINLEVDFFGGEPLMNWNVVKQLVEYGRSQEKEHNKKFRFTLTTNGVLLNDEIMEFCNREMSNVVLSLDGRPEVNDRMRPFRNGKGSYELIVPKFQKFAKSRGEKDYFVRGTFTRNNLDFGNDVLHYADLGFEKLSMEPVVAAPEEPYSIREELRGETYIRATSSLEMKSFCLETWIPAWSTRRCAMNSSSATYTRKKNAKTALRDSTAAADARQIPSTSTAALRMPTISAAKCRKNVSSARL